MAAADLRRAHGHDRRHQRPDVLRAGDIRLRVTLDDLAWWSSALEQARAAGELAPGTMRVRAALAAARS